MLVRSPVPAAAVLGRSLDNFRDTAQIVAKRLVTRAPHYPQILWSIWAVAWLLLTIAVLIRFDDEAGKLWGRWSAGFIDLTDFFTVFGLGGWYLIPSALLLLAANLTDWRSLSRRSLMLLYNWTCLAFLMLSAVGLSGLTVNLLKYGIGRARPVYFNHLGDLSLHPFAMDARFASFPSGHATNMGAVFAIVLLLFPERKYIALALALWVASTRIFVGAHYPSDTVAGFGLGCAIAVACALVFARLGFIFRRTTVGLPVRKRTFRLLWPSRKPDRSGTAQQANFGLQATL
ncbi:phosphatase PAP2 family protein [Mesorhizobium sp. YC-39]|uniref:phosphatase PAP2 family protein n=1 Tax=unclassified Mesorhizobium TaxID=325217 RepID=UPI0021E770B9|nr:MULTISPECIES: phosphatase PAP2 family protein [unclassified Mesorhizobium]MCV3209818.1 phosphatase PAP2 family protein [Mesorhizobium sp. YC-2]MCV3230348.1 phosphatase PAP2 family protein [Mesorhizobium sp. YC-39]